MKKIYSIVPGLVLWSSLVLSSAPALAGPVEDTTCRVLEPPLRRSYQIERKDWETADEAASQVAWAVNRFVEKLGPDNLTLIQAHYRLGFADKGEIWRRVSATVEELRKPGEIDGTRCGDGYHAAPNPAGATLDGHPANPGLNRCMRTAAKLEGDWTVNAKPPFLHHENKVFFDQITAPLWDRKITLVNDRQLNLPAEESSVRICAAIHPDEQHGPEFCHVVELARLPDFRKLTARDILAKNRERAAFPNTAESYFAENPTWKTLGCRAGTTTGIGEGPAGTASLGLDGQGTATVTGIGKTDVVTRLSGLTVPVAGSAGY